VPSLALRLQSRSFRVGLAGTIVAVYLGLALASAALKARGGTKPGSRAPRGTWRSTAAWAPTCSCRRWREGIEQRTYWVMPLYLVTLAGWFKLVGFGLLRMRLLSVLAGLLALVSWFVVMWRVTDDRRVAFLAFALIAVGHASITLASEGRMDMMTAALSVAALAVYLSLRERNLEHATLAGHALAAAAMLTHPNGVLGFVGPGAARVDVRPATPDAAARGAGARAVRRRGDGVGRLHRPGPAQLRAAVLRQRRGARDGVRQPVRSDSRRGVALHRVLRLRAALGRDPLQDPAASRARLAAARADRLLRSRDRVRLGARAASPARASPRWSCSRRQRDVAHVDRHAQALLLPRVL
jgi:hypothetical protein